MRRNRRTQPRVIQIMPADGWRAVWAGDDGDAITDDLVGWALVEIDEDNGKDDENGIRLMSAVYPARQAVVGLVAAEIWVETPEASPSFLGYAPRGEDVDEVWGERARDHAEHEKKRRAKVSEGRP